MRLITRNAAQVSSTTILVYSRNMFRKENGVFFPVDTSVKQAASTELQGSVVERPAGISRIKTRNAASPVNVLRLETDVNLGAITFSIGEFVIDGEVQDVHFEAPSAVDDFIDSIGDFKLFHNGSASRILIPFSGPCGQWRCEFPFQLEDLTWEHNNIDDSFRFFDVNGKQRFCIAPPKVFTKNMRGLTMTPNDIQHSIVADGDNWVYIKESGPEWSDMVVPEEGFFVDSNIVFGETYDGYIEKNCGSDWNARLTNPGTAVDASSGLANVMRIYSDSKSSTLICGRGVLEFDVSALADAPTAVTLFYYQQDGPNGGTPHYWDAFECTKTPGVTVTVNDFASITGSTLLRAYNTPLGSFSKAFNASGIAYVSGKIGSGSAIFTIREDHYDVDGNAPSLSLGSSMNWIWQWNYSEGANPPYLFLTTPSNGGQSFFFPI